MKTVDLSGRPFHFIGIGGIGMSALAYILAKRNLPVSGSDLRSSHITQRLEAVGAKIFGSQEAKNLDLFATNSDFLPQVICSTAIANQNAEYQAAQTQGYPIFHRSELLAALINQYQSIAVAGTHGKTTTSSLIGYLLLEAGLDPTIIVGGEVNAWGGNARLGDSQWLVAEADESDGSLTKLAPVVGIVTNIELDHPDHYQSLAQVVDTFRVFQSQCQTLIACLDCPTVTEQLQPQITYSISPDVSADYTVSNVAYTADGTEAQVWERGQLLGTFKMQLLGKHNLSNALAAIAVCRHLGLKFEQIIPGLASFAGAKRRFEEKGRVNGITFIDDYAHHPSEILATLAAAKLRVDSGEYQRVVAIFQPHRYSRTLSFLAEFASAFGDADVVVITDIYSAGEANPHNLSGQQLVDAIAQYHHQVYYHSELPSLSQRLRELLQPGDLALFLGAGNLNQTIPTLIASYAPE